MAIIQEGRFTSTGQNFLVNLPAGADWIRVYNSTAVIGVTAAPRNFEFYFQKGMETATVPIGGLVWARSAANPGLVNVLPADVNSNFVFVDTSITKFSTPVAVNPVTNAVTPVATTASTAGVGVGSIIRFQNLNLLPTLGNIDWAVGAVAANANFTLASVLHNVPGAANATAGTYSVLPFTTSNYPLFYPSTRVIVDMLAVGGQTAISLNMPSGYTVGQSIRINIPNNIYGVSQMDNIQATVTSVVNDTIAAHCIIVVNTPLIGTFHFPQTADYTLSGPFSMATVTPIGEDTAYAIANGLSVLGDSTVNQGEIGVLLLGGAAAAAAGVGPAGVTGDIMYWQAGTADYVNNQ